MHMDFNTSVFFTGLFDLPMIKLCDTFSLRNHLPSFQAISGAMIFYRSHLDSWLQKYVTIALQ